MWVEQRLSLVRDEDGRIVAVEGIARDVTERKQAEERLERQALHDELTALPNRRLLRDRISQALARAERDRCLVAVLFLDLDRFKLVNDSWGHPAGDKVLVSIADRLRGVVRSGDTVARFGGDDRRGEDEDAHDDFLREAGRSGASARLDECGGETDDECPNEAVAEP